MAGAPATEGCVMRQLNWLRYLPFAFVFALVAHVAGGQGPPAQVAAKPPAGYAGSGECAQCHKLQVAQFTATSKGKLFLEHPRDEREKLGCESCHGPSKQHVESGGEERGGVIAFGKKKPAPVAARN